MVVGWIAATAKVDAGLERDEAVTKGVNTEYLLPHNMHCIVLPRTVRELFEIAPFAE